MATTVNGIIAKNDDSADFLTKEEAASYTAAVLQAGAVIVGRRTYEVLSEQPEFQVFIKNGVKFVVVSEKGVEMKDENHKVAATPQEAVRMLAGEEEVIVAGGGKLNASFIKENLVDELFIDIEPALVGKDISLFDSQDFDRKLRLLGTKMITDQEIQLHYAVIK